MRIACFVAVAVLLVSLHCYAEDDPAEKLKEIESQIVKTVSQLCLKGGVQC